MQAYDGLLCGCIRTSPAGTIIIRTRGDYVDIGMIVSYCYFVHKNADSFSLRMRISGAYIAKRGQILDDLSARRRDGF